MSGTMAPISSERRRPTLSNMSRRHSLELVEQRLRALQVGRVEPLSEPVVDRGQQVVRRGLRPGKTPDGAEVALVLRHVIRRIRARWPKVDILVRGDGHYGRP